MGFSVYPTATNRVKEFTSSGTWVCPSGVYAADFLVVGAGGAGGGVGATAITRYAAAGGGGGGSVKKVTLSTIPGTSYTITIGGKGSGTAAAAGGNGALSEVLNGATVLVRAWGGVGGSGITALDAQVYPTTTLTVAGGGGGAALNTTSEMSAGGGGGAFAAPAYGSSSNTNPIYQPNQNTNNFGGLEGAAGKVFIFNAVDIGRTLGGIGIDGFGAGGGGAATSASAANLVAPMGGAPYGAGVGSVASASGSAVGTAALANTGSGGGGAVLFTSTTSRAGGNGADGFVRIVYFA